VDPAVNTGIGGGSRVSGSARYGLPRPDPRVAILNTTVEIPDSLLAEAKRYAATGKSTAEAASELGRFPDSRVRDRRV
jgi:hypothetical protein